MEVVEAVETAAHLLIYRIWGRRVNGEVRGVELESHDVVVRSDGRTKMVMMGAIRRLLCKAKKVGLVVREVSSMNS